MSEWIVGDGARIPVTIADAAGQPIDPDLLRIKVMAPNDVSTTYTYGSGADVVREGIGRYYIDILLTASGHWHWRWESDAPKAGIAEGLISVRRSRFIEEA